MPRNSAILALRGIAAFLIAAAFALPLHSSAARASELAIPLADPDQTKTIEIEWVSLWLRTRFSESELEALSGDDLQVEARFCGCYDKPTAHFPYAVVLITTPKGDLLARPDSVEGFASFTPLAVRYGKRYCEVESEGRCYGSFADVCQFTDFRYGPYLAAFFPTCKPDHVVRRPTQADGVSDPNR